MRTPISVEHILSLLDLKAEKTNFYCEESKASPTHRISVVRHVQDPEDLFPTSEKGAEDDNDISSESAHSYLSIPILDWGLTFPLEERC